MLYELCSLLELPLKAGRLVLVIGFGSSNTWRLEGDLAEHFDRRATQWLKILQSRGIPVINPVNVYAQIENPELPLDYSRHRGHDHFLAKESEMRMLAAILHFVIIHNFFMQIRNLALRFETIGHEIRLLEKKRDEVRRERPPDAAEPPSDETRVVDTKTGISGTASSPSGQSSSQVQDNVKFYEEVARKQKESQRSSPILEEPKKREAPASPVAPPVATPPAAAPPPVREFIAPVAASSSSASSSTQLPLAPTYSKAVAPVPPLAKSFTSKAMEPTKSSKPDGSHPKTAPDPTQPTAAPPPVDQKISPPKRHLPLNQPALPLGHPTRTRQYNQWLDRLALFYFYRS